MAERRPPNTFASDATGAMAVTAALTLPVLVAVSLIAVEIAQMATDRSKLQEIADSAALAGARELRLGNAIAQTVIAQARRHAQTAAGQWRLAHQFDGAVSADKKSVTVTLSTPPSMGITATLGLTAPHITVTATAKVMGGSPVCGVSLNTTDHGALYLEKQARLEAAKCAIYSNSKNPSGLESKDSARINAGFICSAGGFKGSPASFDPLPEIDCPAFPDPLASRAPPSFGDCDPARQNLKISGAGVFLTPGVFCGGIRVEKDSDVTLQPGVYIIKDGPIVLDKNARLRGTQVGLYFTGEKSGITISKETSLSLTAPTSGPMAGLLMFQDRSIKRDDVKFEISSDDASVLLGTIYLPRGHLLLGGDKPVAQKSAYTIIVANKIQASAGPTLVLNSDYAATDVPTPNGLGSLSGQIALQ